MPSEVWTPRVTVAALVALDGRFLMVEENTEDGMVFNQPAGHLEDGETLLDAVVRETLEETAWTFLPQGLVGIYRWRMPDSGRTYLRFCFHGHCRDHRPDRPLDQDIQGTRWMSRGELAACGRLRSPLVLTCIDDYRSGQSHSLALLREL